MKELEKLFTDVGRIADAMEERNRLLTKLEMTVSTEKEVQKDTTPAPAKALQDFAQAIQPLQVAPAPVQTPVATPSIPVTNAVQTYTQEQLSLAMARGLDMGLQEQVQNVIHSFGVDCLMKIAPENYGALALKLKAIGIEV